MVVKKQPTVLRHTFLWNELCLLEIHKLKVLILNVNALGVKKKLRLNEQ